jgi:hypothetical protein
MEDRERSAMARALRASATLLIGILAGAMAEEYLLLRVVLSDLPGEAWVGVHAKLADVHPYTVVPAAVLGSVFVMLTPFVERDTRSRRALATWVAVSIAVSIGMLTSLVMMPLNEVIQEWATAGVPAQWHQTRDTWSRLQGLRAALSIVGFTALVVATQLSGAPPRAPRPT